MPHRTDRAWRFVTSWLRNSGDPLVDEVRRALVLTCAGMKRWKACQRVLAVTEREIEPTGASLYCAGHPPRIAR